MINNTLCKEFSLADVEQINDIALLVLEDKRIVYCNSAAANLFGCNTKKELLAIHPFMLSPQYQPCGALSVTKANYMMDIARISGQHQFEWLHKSAANVLFNVNITLQAGTWNEGKKCIVAYLLN